MSTKPKLKSGDQIAYVPQHATGSIEHPDVEVGFVTSIADDGQHAFCRYWNVDTTDLRTKSNSERTPLRFLRPFKSVPQVRIDLAIQKYGITIQQEEGR